ncbi:MAG: hypothetical protein ACXABY_01925 [Candidatus Thorarchaeota archaeon]|jgi:hypothetical protein
MTATMKKYASPSTPNVEHDLQNFIVEAILINRHGALPSGGWRKSGPFAKVWGQLLTKVKRVSKLGLDAQQLAWFVQFYKVTDLDYKEFGLLRWKIKQYFKWCNVDKFVAYYTQLHKTLVGKSHSYVEETTGYKVKEASSNRKKTLSDILKELENSND